MLDWQLVSLIIGYLCFGIIVVLMSEIYPGKKDRLAQMIRAFVLLAWPLSLFCSFLYILFRSIREG